jgi:hypothetical protein
MNEHGKIEIALSKQKLTKLLLFSIAFLIAGLWMIIKNPQISNPVFNNPVVKFIGGYGGLLMGLLGTYYFTKMLFDSAPGLIISEEGLYENTSIFKFGLIPWSDIAAIDTRSMQVSFAAKQHFITIYLDDPGKYIEREKNIIKRKLLAANTRSYGSPVHISTNGLKMNHQELTQLLYDYSGRYKEPVGDDM